MTINEAIEQAKPGQFIIIGALGHPVRITDIITSWAFRALRKESDGSVTRAA